MHARAVITLFGILLAGFATTDANADEERPWITSPKSRDEPSAGARPARVGGALLLVAGYVPAAFVGATSILMAPFQTGWMGGVGSMGGGGGGGRHGLAPLVLPFVGPFIYAVDGGADTLWKVEEGSMGIRALALASGVAQVAGFALFVHDVDQVSRRARRTRGDHASFSVTPSVLPAGGGLTLAWSE